MSVYEIIDAALAPAAEYYYHGMPEFAEGEEPEKYAVYTVQETPACFASGEAQSTRYFIPVNIFTPGVDTDFKDGIISAMKSIGATYGGGQDVTGDTGYPGKNQYAMDFVLNIDK